MKIKFIGKLPPSPVVAVSGGADSMAILNFFKRKKPTVLHFNHGTEHGNEAEKFITGYCSENDINLITGHASRDKRKSESMEEYWRNIRYDFLDETGYSNIITAHNLDDQVEQWVFSALNGKPYIMKYRRGNIIRPFLLTKKASMELWCELNNVPFIVDPGNNDLKYMRSYIRREIVPRSLCVNPGLYKVIAKKVKMLEAV